MNLFSSKHTKEHTHEPLHQLLLELSKSWLQWPSRVRPKGNNDLNKRLIATTVQQLVTSIRMKELQGDDETMLASLENLVMAGEISFKDFMQRVENLFPHAVDALDVPLRMRINALIASAS